MDHDKNYLGVYFCPYTQKPAHFVRVSEFRRFKKLSINIRRTCSLLGRLTRKENVEQRRCLTERTKIGPDMGLDKTTWAFTSAPLLRDCPRRSCFPDFFASIGFAFNAAACSVG
jgi:hypothetical protein